MPADSTLVVAISSSLGVVALCACIGIVYYCYKWRSDGKSNSSYTESEEGTSTFSPDIKMRTANLQAQRRFSSFHSQRGLPFRHCPSVTTLESNRTFDGENSEFNFDDDCEERRDYGGYEEKELTLHDDEVLALQKALKMRLEQKHQSLESIDKHSLSPSSVSVQSHNQVPFENQDIVLY